jgi:hypothetical protein
VRKVKGALLSSEEAKAAVDAMFESQNATDELPELPEYSPGFSTIVEKTFDIDIAAEYAILEDQIVINDALTPQTIRTALNKTEDNARRAHQIYVAAKVEHELYEIEAAKVEAAMREIVIKEMSADKAVKIRSKQISEADVAARMALSFPDEYVAIVSRRSKARQAVEHLKRLADLWQTRSRTLNSLNNN